MPKKDWRHCDCCATHQRAWEFKLCDMCGHEVCAYCYNWDFDACEACIQDSLRELAAGRKKPVIPDDACCKTCGWAEWVMCAGKRKRVNQSRAGKCQYPIEKVVVPACVDAHYAPRKSAIWYRDDEYIGCPCWKEKT